MGNEQDQSKENGESKQVVLRSPEEIQKRIEELEMSLKLNSFQINIGTYANPTMVPTPLYEILMAQRNELRWFLGENVDITDGVE